MASSTERYTFARAGDGKLKGEINAQPYTRCDVAKRK